MTLDQQIEVTGDKKEQLIKLCVKHLLDSDYRFDLHYRENGLATIDLGPYGRVIFDKQDTKKGES